MIDLFVVVYEEDYPLLKILARSIDRFCKNLPITNIVIVENSNNTTYSMQDIMPHFGDFSAIVKIMHWHKIYNGHLAQDGYVRQQVLKLLAHKVCTAENIIILDSKNFFVRSVEKHNFIKNEKLLSSWDNKIKEGDLPQYPLKKYAFDLFGVSMENDTFPMITPFQIKRKFLEELEYTLLNKFNLTPDSFFGNFVPAKTNEFYPMQAYIIANYGSLENHYFIERFTNSLWDTDLHLLNPKINLCFKFKYLLQYTVTHNQVKVSHTLSLFTTVTAMKTCVYFIRTCSKRRVYTPS